MDTETRRRLAALRARERPAIRPAAEVTQQVADSQILDEATARPRVIPLVHKKKPALDPLARDFFAAGERQEASGVFIETERVRVRSLDRVPRRWWARLTMAAALLLLAAGCAAAAAWRLGVRPPAEWQRTRAWQALHLPALAPPAN
jgi:hypothetical protein